MAPIVMVGEGRHRRHDDVGRQPVDGRTSIGTRHTADRPPDDARRPESARSSVGLGRDDAQRGSVEGDRAVVGDDEAERSPHIGITRDRQPLDTGAHVGAGINSDGRLEREVGSAAAHVGTLAVIRLRAAHLGLLLLGLLRHREPCYGATHQTTTAVPQPRLCCVSDGPGHPKRHANVEWRGVMGRPGFRGAR